MKKILSLNINFDVARGLSFFLPFFRLKFFNFERCPAILFVTKPVEAAAAVVVAPPTLFFWHNDKSKGNPQPSSWCMQQRGQFHFATQHQKGKGEFLSTSSSYELCPGNHHLTPDLCPQPVHPFLSASASSCPAGGKACKIWLAASFRGETRNAMAPIGPRAECHLCTFPQSPSKDIGSFIFYFGTIAWKIVTKNQVDALKKCFPSGLQS